METVQEELKTPFETVKARSSEVLENVKNQSNQFIEDSADLVRRYPGRAVGIAVLSGLAIGIASALLLGREEETSYDKFRSTVGKKASQGLDTLREQIDCGLSALQDKIEDIQKAIR